MFCKVTVNIKSRYRAKSSQCGAESKATSTRKEIYHSRSTHTIHHLLQFSVDRITEIVSFK